MDCRARWLQELWPTGSVAPRYVGSSQTGDWTGVPCIARQTANHWAVRESESHSVMSNSLQPHGLYSPWNSPGQNTGVSSHSLLQGIFPTQGSNPGLPHYRRILHQLSHQGSPIEISLVFTQCPFSVPGAHPGSHPGTHILFICDVSLGSSWLWLFTDFSWFWWPWQFCRVLVFCIMSLNWDFWCFSLNETGKIKGVKSHFHHIISRAHDFINIYVNFDQMAEVKFVRFLYCKSQLIFYKDVKLI